MNRRKGGLANIITLIRNLIPHFVCRQPTLLRYTITRHHHRALPCNIARLLAGILRHHHMKVTIRGLRLKTCPISIRMFHIPTRHPAASNLSTAPILPTVAQAVSLLQTGRRTMGITPISRQ
jgi:hypothetical protein